jgi:hypothetical protein
MKPLNQNGFGLGEAFIALVIICALTFGGYKVAQNINKADDTKDQTASQTDGASTKQQVTWQFNGNDKTWQSTGDVPACPTPVLSRSPVDMSLATGVLYPGQYRGFNYKPHGGIGFSGHKSSDIAVYAPMDGKLTGLVRYIESGEIQYKLTFVNDCGISFYFDHLYTLSDKMQTVAETTPEPKADDTRSLPLQNPVDVQEGQLIATAVGHPATNNVGMDFGVIDYRSRNEISKNATWQGLHTQYADSEWYGRCWFGMLPKADAKIVKNLPLVNPSNIVSDYCSAPGGTTLDRNDGKPTNG